MNYSYYQETIFDEIANGKGHVVVKARAGSGKTTTIVEAISRIPKTKSTIFVAFNKHIATELQNRGVNACTLNSFGFKMFRQGCAKRTKINVKKTANILKYKIFNLAMASKETKTKCFKCIYAVTKLIGLMKSHAVDPKDVKNVYEDLSVKHGIDIPEYDDFLHILTQTYLIGIEQKNVIDFDDQLFLPIYMDLPIEQYDYVFVDEAQDLNPVQIELVKRMGKDGRVIAVGDEYQAIYGFRGADPDAIDNIIAGLNAKTLPLSICYRCPKLVVQEAQKIVPDIEWHDDAEIGIVEQIDLESFEKLADDGDYVLCRTTAPLVKSCLMFIRNHRKATVKGREIGQQLAGLIEKITEDRSADIQRFLESLNQYASDETDKLKKRGRDAEIMALQDRVDTISALSHNAETVDDLHLRIAQIFSDNVSGIVFCTIHRAKGLEAKRIFILKPELLPHPMAKQPWQQKQERNLKYVAVTRSQGELYWVS